MIDASIVQRPIVNSIKVPCSPIDVGSVETPKKIALKFFIFTKMGYFELYIYDAEAIDKAKLDIQMKEYLKVMEHTIFGRRIYAVYWTTDCSPIFSKAPNPPVGIFMEIYKPYLIDVWDLD